MANRSITCYREKSPPGGTGCATAEQLRRIPFVPEPRCYAYTNSVLSGTTHNEDQYR